MTSMSGEDAAAPVKFMRLRYAGTCEVCGADLQAGTHAGYLRATKTVRCLECLETQQPGTAEAQPHEPAANAVQEPNEPGTAGSSARREYERRATKREARIREAHPRLGGLILALSDEPQSTTAWDRGARGEELLGTRLDGLAARASACCTTVASPEPART